MNLPTQPYKGARDFYPEDKRLQKYIFEVLRGVSESFGYQEYDAPLLEPIELYKAKTGDEIVNEQTYVFTDRGDRQVAIRPEMTPSVSRLVAGRRQALAYPLRLYNIGQRWRYERPQRGRSREFWQLDVDLFGVPGIEGDAEIIQVADTILKRLGADSSQYEIRLNSRVELQKAVEASGVKSSVSQVLRLIDAYDKLGVEKFREDLAGQVDKPKELEAYLEGGEPPEPIASLMEMLKTMDVEVHYHPSLARGFDYYTDIVFEVFDKHPDNSRSLFGGGRYDGLVGLFGVEPIPTVGFAVGDVTLLNFLETHHLMPELAPETAAVAILVGDVFSQAQAPLSQLRQAGIGVAIDPTDRKLDSKIKSAAKSGVHHAIFIGEKELADNRYTLRDLESGQERQLSIDEIVSDLKSERE